MTISQGGTHPNMLQDKLIGLLYTDGCDTKAFEDTAMKTRQEVETHLDE